MCQKSINVLTDRVPAVSEGNVVLVGGISVLRRHPKRQGFSGLLRANEAQGAIYPRHPQSPSWSLHRLAEIFPRLPGRSI